MERPVTATAPLLRRQFRTEVTKNSPKTSAKQTHPLPTLPTGSRIQGKIFLSYHLPFSRRYYLLRKRNLNDDVSRRSPTPDQDLEPPPLKIQLPSPGAASATSSDPPAQKQYEPTLPSTTSSESSTVKVRNPHLVFFTIKNTISLRCELDFR